MSLRSEFIRKKKKKKKKKVGTKAFNYRIKCAFVILWYVFKLLLSYYIPTKQQSKQLFGTGKGGDQRPGVRPSCLKRVSSERVKLEWLGEARSRWSLPDKTKTNKQTNKRKQKPRPIGILWWGNGSLKTNPFYGWMRNEHFSGWSKGIMLCCTCSECYSECLFSSLLDVVLCNSQSVPQERTCLSSFTCCHLVTEVAYQIYSLTQSL